MSKKIYFIPTIVCVVGPSGCGKTTMARFIEKALGIPMLVSYTTRPKREGEIEGVDHHFVTEAEMPPQDQMLAYTNFGGYHYWMPFSEIPYEHPGICTYVIDEKGLQMLKEKYSDQFGILSILIKRDRALLEKQVGADRVQRDLARITIPEEEYNAVIENNDRVEDFLAESLHIYQNLFF